MVELDYFSQETFDKVLQIVKDFRGLTDLHISGNIRYDVPISRPSKILCLGRNYRAHAQEMNNPVPEAPIFFAKMPSALLAHEGAIRIPGGIGRVDHEIELAVIIGKKGRNIKEEKAMEHVAGYTIADDVTAREMQKAEAAKGKPWTLAKGMDTFCPMGPYLVPADAVADAHNLKMELSVNGETRQKGHTGDMVFKLPELISYISRFMTLEAGDIILTGTPEGVSPIKPGDRIECRVDQLGALVNTVMAAD
ncbi:fumarylacetoacetate hydrolase family protein [candidate division KSB1 bacterium]|nr:fumarylacetoacetate hydrolase family protein [candidate division KSB1 bacterium]